MESQEVTLLETAPKKRIPKILLAVVITAVISVFISFLAFYLIFLGNDRYAKLRELDFLVNNYYYGDIDKEKITDSVLKGYVSGLEDRFSSFHNAEETKKRSNTLSGSAEGIGIIVTKHPDTGNIFVNNVYEGAPADKAGIISGDQISAIDSVPVTDTGYTEAVNSIMREIGDTVKLTVLREEKTFEITVEYAEFKAQSVFWQITDNNFGYVEITSFNDETVVQFKNAVNQLTQKNIRGIIFDLRGNGGGTVSSVTEMVDMLCPEGVVMTVKYADGKEEIMAKSDSEEIDLPMAVLTDGATASASELFAASIKDFNKGVTVGEKTFGKGVMQTTYNLLDGSSAVLTVAEFFPHSGESFNKTGITPDIAVELTEEQLKYRHQLSIDADPVVLAAVDYLNNYDKE